MFDPAPEPKTPLGKLRLLSPTAGLRMSPLQLGGMSIGSAWKEIMGSMDKEQSFKLLDAYYEAGGRSIDTANNYQNDDSENWIGDWMKERGNRDEMVIATKFTSPYAAYRLGKTESGNFTGNHRKSLALSLRDSLKKLKTDYVDILYMHWYDYTTPVEEVMNALNDVVVAGKVLYLGVSDTPAWWVAAANTYAKAHGKSQFVIYQGRWNVMIRDFEREILPMARHFGMALAPWDVLGSGKLQSKKALEERKKSGEQLRKMMGDGSQTEQEIKFSEVLVKIAEAHGLESPTTIALAYVMNKAPYVFPIIGGRKVEHLHDNIKAIELKLTDDEIKQIESVKPFEVGFPNDFLGPNPHTYSTQQPGLTSGMMPNIAYVKDSKPV